MAAAAAGVITVIFVAIIMGDYVKESVQLKSSHPMHGVVDGINGNGGPYIGLVMAYPTEEAVLVDSGLFVPSSDLPNWVDLSGRRFNIGKIRGVDVIYVMTGEQTLNAGITVQLLVDAFDIKGIVHYGTAGSANDTLALGDVSIPKHVAFTGSWKWKKFHSEKGNLPELNFGAYNVPARGENLLATIEFTREEVFSNEQPMEEVFWLPIEPKWFSLASQLVDLELLQCVNETYCLPETPKVVYGLRGSTADVFLDNAAYRKFLFSEFNISTVDEESSAVLMTSITNGVPCIVFRGVSDLAGGAAAAAAGGGEAAAAAAAAGGGGGEKLTSVLTLSSSSSLSSLASVNALTVAVEFIGLIGSITEYPNQDQ